MNQVSFCYMGNITQNMKFSIRDFFSKSISSLNQILKFLKDMVTSTDKILNEKLFLCIVK